MRLRCLAVLLLAIPTLSFGQNLAKRDSAGVSVLREMLTQTGWHRALLPIDARAVGDITVYDNDGGILTTGTIEIRTRGPKKFAIQTNLQGEEATSVYSEGFAIRKSGTERMQVPARTLSPILLPVFADWWDVDDGTWGVEYQGLDVVNSQPVHRIRLWRELPVTDPRYEEVRRGSPVTIWISQSESLPVQIEYRKASFENRLAFATYVRQFSDFRKVKNRLLPFRHDEWVLGKRLRSIRFRDIDTDVGVDGAEFELKGGN